MVVTVVVMVVVVVCGWVVVRWATGGGCEAWQARACSGERIRSSTPKRVAQGSQWVGLLHGHTMFGMGELGPMRAVR